MVMQGWCTGRSFLVHVVWTKTILQMQPQTKCEVGLEVNVLRVMYYELGKKKTDNHRRAQVLRD